MQQRPVYNQTPSSSSSPQPVYQPTPDPANDAAPSPPSQPAPTQTPSQPAPGEAPRRPQAIASGAAPAQAATACMNEQKSASADTAIKGCDAVIGETLKNLANAYYFRGSAKFARAISTARSAITARRSPRSLGRQLSQQPRRRLRSQEGRRPRTRRLQRGDQDQPQYDLRLQQPRRRLSTQGRFARAAADYGEMTRSSRTTRRLDAAARCARSLPAKHNRRVGVQRGAQDQVRRCRRARHPRLHYLKLGQTDNAIKDMTRR